MYTIHGALGSPYSMKMRALFRYRRIVHIWKHGGHAQQLAAEKVRAPVIPVIEYPDGSFHNDSTPLLYDLEERHNERIVDAERYCLPVSCSNLILKNEEQIDEPKWPCVTVRSKPESYAFRSAA